MSETYIDRSWADEHYHCEASFTIPDGVKEIGFEAFLFCTSLTSVTIPESVTKIGSHAFAGSKSLTSIILPDGVTEIGEYAFCGCTNLTSIVIPDSVTAIGYSAFNDCNNLTIHCTRGSAAEKYAREHKIPVAYEGQKKTKKQDSMEDV